MSSLLPGRVGLALGSGASRGWAHIGVIRALEAAGIVPDVVCGSSVGAIVGAAYASGNLDAFEKWVSGLDRGRVLRNLDLSFRGGLLKGAQFFSFMSPELPDRRDRGRCPGPSAPSRPTWPRARRSGCGRARCTTRCAPRSPCPA